MSLIRHILFITFACIALTSYAKNEKKMAFPAEKVVNEASICVNHLKLRGDSAEKFVEIYMEYRRKIHNALEANKGSHPGISRSKLTREQVDRNIRNRFASAKAILNIREQYYQKFLKVMSPRQYEQLNELEQKMTHEMRKEVTRRRNSSSKSTSSSASKNRSQTSMSTKDAAKLRKDLQQARKDAEKARKDAAKAIRDVNKALDKASVCRISTNSNCIVFTTDNNTAITIDPSSADEYISLWTID